MAQDGYNRELGARLRALRQAAGLSLHGVERRTGGQVGAVVLGSYERGDRAVSVAKLADLAGFYGVSVSGLLPESAGAVSAESDKSAEHAMSNQPLIVDLRRLAELPTQQVGPLARYVAAIQSERENHNDDVLTIRARDLQTLAIMFDMRPESLRHQLVGWGVLRI